ncbi:MAG: hypothetical protein Fur0027_19680 [Raineya sp.]
MARTKEQIEQEILQAKRQEASLSELNSVSQTAIWRLWVKITAFMHNVLEQLFDVFRAEIDTLIANSRAGAAAWYVAKIRAFQNGDVLNASGEYSVTDPAKQIISRCSVNENGSVLNIKVAKNEPPMQLNAAELANFVSYINNIKFAGVATNIISLPADAVIVDIEILYSQIREEAAKEAVKSSIQDYIKNIAFDGQFVLNDLIALCRNNQGVVDVLVNSIEINGNPVTGGRYTAASGYYSFDGDDASNNYIMTQV